MDSNQPSQQKFSASKKQMGNLNGMVSSEDVKLLTLLMTNQLMINPNMVITETNPMVTGVITETSPMVTGVITETNPMVTMVTSLMVTMVTNQMKNQNQLISLPSLIILVVKKLN